MTTLTNDELQQSFIQAAESSKWIYGEDLPRHQHMYNHRDNLLEVGQDAEAVEAAYRWFECNNVVRITL